MNRVNCLNVMSSSLRRAACSAKGQIALNEQRAFTVLSAKYFLPALLKRTPARAILSFLVASSIAASPVTTYAAAQQQAGVDLATGSMRVTSVDPDGTSVDVKFETKVINSESVTTELATALATGAGSVIVSSDDYQVLAQARENSKTKAPGHVFLIPFGQAIRKSADVVGGANQLIRNSGQYLVNAAKKDKLGFAIATFTLSNEVIRWVHVTTASNFVVTSNIIYAILWASIFVDKDTWSRATKPIQRLYRRLFGLSEVIPDHPSAQDTSLKFLAGLTLSLTLNAGRATLVGIDQLAQHTFSLLNLSMPFVIGAVMTAAGFSWSELMGSIDEAKYPRTKKGARFVMNSKSCLVSYFAASAMLMNPADYGVMPWIAVAVSGITGLVLYSNVKKVLPQLERLGRREAASALTCEELFQ